MKVAQDKLSAAKIRVNAHRLTLLHLLMADRDHPTALELFHKMKGIFPGITLATVYNTLKVLKNKGLVQGVAGSGKRERFDSIDDGHGHFLCMRCGSLYDIPAALCGTRLPPPVMDGHRVTERQILLSGICRDCLGSVQEDPGNGS